MTHGNGGFTICSPTSNTSMPSTGANGRPGTAPARNPGGRCRRFARRWPETCPRAFVGQALLGAMGGWA